MTLQFACERFLEPGDLKNDACSCGPDPADALIDLAIDAASDLLTLLSGGRVGGVCSATFRPVQVGGACYPTDDEQFGLWPMARLGGMNAIPLRGPNPEVLSVIIDGVQLNPLEYGLIDNRFLFRREGNWPSNSNLRLLPNAVGVFEIEQRWGRPIDFISKQAGIELACELLKAFAGSQSALPPGATSANLQGVSVRIADELTGDTTRQGLERVQRFFNVYGFEGEGQSDVWTPELANGWQLVQVEGPAGS